MAVRQRKPLGDGDTYADEVMRAWDRMKPEPRSAWKPIDDAARSGAPMLLAEEFLRPDMEKPQQVMVVARWNARLGVWEGWERFWFLEPTHYQEIEPLPIRPRAEA